MSAAVLPPFWSLVEAHGDELLATPAGSPATSTPRTSCRTRCCARCARIRGCATPSTCARGSTASPRRPRWTTTAPAAARCSTDDPPAAAAEPEHYDDAFEALIAPLPDGAQAALRLRFVDDLDYEGIAARLGCSPEAARQRVSTAIRTLRTQGIPA